jgi:hypothetical protein
MSDIHNIILVLSTRLDFKVHPLTPSVFTRTIGLLEFVLMLTTFRRSQPELSSC